MKSSFLLTHQIRSTYAFSFLDYLRAAMEEDFSHVVGLGLPMWCFIIIFVLLSADIGDLTSNPSLSNSRSGPCQQ